MTSALPHALPRFAALILYEQLALLAKRRHPQTSFDIKAIRQLLGLGAAISRDCDLLRKIVKPAIREIERVTGLVVEPTVERERRHGALQRITLRVVEPSRKNVVYSPPTPRKSPTATTLIRPSAIATERQPAQEGNPSRDAGTESVRMYHGSDNRDVPPQNTRSSVSPVKAIFDRGVTLLAHCGRDEVTARSCIAKLRQLYDDGYIAVAIDKAWRRDDVVEPYSWLLKFLGKYQTRAETEQVPKKLAGVSGPGSQRVRPLATPEFLGLSAGLAQRIREQNERLRNFDVIGFGR